jgi:hypothetical protein
MNNKRKMKKKRQISKLRLQGSNSPVPDDIIQAAAGRLYLPFLWTSYLGR